MNRRKSRENNNYTNGGQPNLEQEEVLSQNMAPIYSINQD